MAFLPPVSGGTEGGPAEIAEDGSYFALTRRAIDPRALAARLMDGAEGAVVTFEGTVRNNTKGRRTRFLEYEGYEPLALATMARIGREIAAAREIGRIAIVHRLGRVLVGETSVAVVATAPHRRPAFEAACEAIDRLKQTVPIWKKEYFADGEVWVEGERDRDDRRARALVAALLAAGRRGHGQEPSFRANVTLVHAVATVKNRAGELVGALRRKISRSTTTACSRRSRSSSARRRSRSRWP